jgi:methionyl-tRNA formyltransferase
MLPCVVNTPLIVFHDSLLPRYRGFAPLVCALINGEFRIGVTALLAGEAYDDGPILGQECITITYPLSIGAAIKTVCPCYIRLVDGILERLDRRDFAGRLQAETEASYSLWRDAEDYRINWQADALQVVRFIDATGFPYLGASATAEGRLYRVLASTALPDMPIENRTPGKVFRLDDGYPIVVCGRGLLRIERMVEEGMEVTALPWRKLRTRFK